MAGPEVVEADGSASGSEDEVGREEDDAGLVLPTPNEMNLFKTLFQCELLDAGAPSSSGGTAASSSKSTSAKDASCKKVVSAGPLRKPPAH